MTRLLALPALALFLAACSGGGSRLDDNPAAAAESTARGITGQSATATTSDELRQTATAPARTVEAQVAATNTPSAEGPTPVPATAIPPTPRPAPRCDPNYTGACIPPYPPDLDCTQIAARRFQSIGSDPHGFDRDLDGIACES